MKKTNIKVKFNITGNDFEPNHLTEKLKIKPTKIWRKGDKVENRKKDIKRKFNCWFLGTEYENSYDINNQLKKIVNIIKNKKSELNELRNSMNLEYMFEIVINIENNETPAVYLDSYMIEFANSIKAEFDFDIYVFS